ncbi:MAG: phospholipase A [Xanthomonadaceae bacterium]|nr:phospholipase A [Xanthomonadaceae bacterium]
MLQHSALFPWLLLAALASLPSAALAQAGPDTCHAIDGAAERLACYDRATGRGTDAPGAASRPPPAGREPFPVRTDRNPQSRTSMAQHWETGDAENGGLFQVRAHNPVYALPVRATTNRNQLPSSPAPGRTLEEPLGLDSIEAKFQISLKTKALDNILGLDLDLWFGYTQIANWQAYDGVESSPFRETNYQPETFLTFGPGIDLFDGWRWEVLNLGLIHESNGRNLPRSRSWNRIYAQFGFERENISIYARPWWRISESRNDDDNPDIRQFMGSHDLRVVYSHNGNDFGLLTRYSFSGDRGAVQADWHFPLIGALKGYVQLTSGYGESLIDYNHKQTTLGVGVSLVEAR